MRAAGVRRCAARRTPPPPARREVFAAPSCVVCAPTPHAPRRPVWPADRRLCEQHGRLPPACRRRRRAECQRLRGCAALRHAARGRKAARRRRRREAHAGAAPAPVTVTALSTTTTSIQQQLTAAPGRLRVRYCARPRALGAGRTGAPALPQRQAAGGAGKARFLAASKSFRGERTRLEGPNAPEAAANDRYRNAQRQRKGTIVVTFMYMNVSTCPSALALRRAAASSCAQTRPPRTPRTGWHLRRRQWTGARSRRRC